MTKTRTRFAPSPTGFIHLGNIRSALYPWAFARATGGDFILRIEDTDEDRSTQAAVDVILEGMRWLGLDPDEGPFYQMQRIARYKEVLLQLQQDFFVAGHALHLVERAFVRLQPQPAHTFQNHIDSSLRAAVFVGVFDAQNKVATGGARKSPRIQSRADIAQVDKARGRRRKAGACFSHANSDSKCVQATQQVVLHITHMFQPHGHADQALADAGGLALRLGQFAMRGAGRVRQ